MLRPIFFLAFFIALVFGANPVNAQSYKWAKGGGSAESLPSSSESEKAQFMCTDANGNVYVLSNVGGSSGFPITADTFYRPTGAFGNNRNVFLSSYDCDGNMRWAKLIASPNSTRPFGIAADSLGHIYISGSFPHIGGTQTLHVGYDTSINTYIYLHICVMQFDTSGNFNWIRFVGNNTVASTSALATSSNPIAIDNLNNLHYICYMKSGVILSPSVTSVRGTYDLIYDPFGNLLNIRRIQLDSTLISGGSVGNGAAIDKQSGKLYLFGTKHADFSVATSHSFIAAFDTSGNQIWKDTLSNPYLPGSVAFGSIAADGYGHLYLTGEGSRCAVFKNDTVMNVLSTLSYPVSFILKIDTSGSVSWMKGYSATTAINSFYSITLLPNNKIASVGSMAGNVVTGSHSITSYAGEGQNSFFTIVDSAGYLFTLQQIHGSGFYDGAFASAADNAGNLYIGGKVEHSTWGGSITPYTSVGGNTDFFVMKYGVDCSCTTLPIASYSVTGATTRVFTYTGIPTSVGTGIDSVRWDFGDGTTSTLFNPTHTYLSAGTFAACIRVYTPCGSDMYCTDVLIPCVSAPASSLSMTGTGLTRTFTYTGTTAGVSSISWTFTDGGVDAGSPVIHTFSAAATYTACVTAVNACGSTTTCNPITVTCTSTPVSAYTVSGAGLTKIFNYTGTTTGLDSVRWTFGDGGIATGLTPGHAYAAAGTYTVCATVYTNCGSHTYCSPIVVTCITAPVASFTSSGSDLTRTFTYSGTTAGMDSVRWNFGDGITSIVLSPIHTFSAAGTYTVCVTVYTNCGSHTYCSPITVTCLVPPIASFTFSGTGAAKTFTYTGSTTGMDSVRWNFGDGGTSTILSPAHTFLTEDTFNVCVRIYTNCGSHISCQDVIATCFSPVVSAFTDTGSLVHGFAYTGTMPGYDSVVWNFGDGNADTGLITIHTYAVADTYNVCAKVYTDCGTHTFCRNIIILVTTSVSSISAANIHVYPNPSTDELFITGIAQKTDYRILNVVGVSLQQGILTNGSNTISIQNIPTGMYLLELVGVDGTRKVVRIAKM